MIPNLSLTAVLVLSVMLRLGAALYLGDTIKALPGTADQVSYHQLALRVLAGEGFSFGEAWWPATAANAPTAHWSYLYTFYLVSVYALFGVQPLAARLIQALIVGIVQPYVVYKMTEQLLGLAQKDPGSPTGADAASRAPLFSALITAVYAYFIYYSAALVTEAFFITVVLLFLFLSQRLASELTNSDVAKWGFMLGCVLASGVLLRQLLFLFFPAYSLWVFLKFRNRKKQGAGVLAVILLVVLSAIVPFSIYNYLRFGQFVALNTNAGFAFYWSNHPTYGTRFRVASEMGDVYQRLIPLELRGMNEAAMDRELLMLGLDFVLEEPGRFIRLTLSRIPPFFKFWTSADSGTASNLARVLSFGVFLPFMLWGLVTTFLRALRSYRVQVRGVQSSLGSFWLLLLFVMTHCAIHLVSWVQVRYRLPVDAILVVFAGLALAELANSQRLAVFGVARQSFRRKGT